MSGKLLLSPNFADGIRGRLLALEQNVASIKANVFLSSTKNTDKLSLSNESAINSLIKHHTDILESKLLSKINDIRRKFEQNSHNSKEKKQLTLSIFDNENIDPSKVTHKSTENILQLINVASTKNHKYIASLDSKVGLYDICTYYVNT